MDIIDLTSKETFTLVNPETGESVTFLGSLAAAKIAREFDWVAADTSLFQYCLNSLAIIEEAPAHIPEYFTCDICGITSDKNYVCCIASNNAEICNGRTTGCEFCAAGIPSED